MSLQKRGRVKLTGEAFTQWRLKVLTRDGWRCRRCNCPESLQVHHIVKRSEVRLDTMENAVTLCNCFNHRCHDKVEGKVRGQRVTIVGDNANLKTLGFRWAEE